MTGRILPASSVALTLLAGGCADPASSATTRSQAELGQRAWVTTDSDGARVIQAHVSARVDVEPASVGGLLAVGLERSELTTASQAMHDELHRCGGFMLERSSDVARTAAAQGLPTKIATRALPAQYAIDNSATVTALMAPLGETRLRQTIQSLADFPTRMHDTDTGRQASVWIRDRWQSYVAGRADVTVALVDHEETPQPSIALTIRGTKFPDEHVILGGHMDSINQDPGPAPGADDNASGIAALDEVAHAALTLGYMPERTVTFYAYAAEEVGLVGSSEIAEQALDQDLNVVGVLQLDMTNFNPSPNPYLAIVTDYTDETLNQLARDLIDQYIGLPWKNTECGYACSDHGSWQRRGFPVHFVHEATLDESNKDIHTARDTLARSNGSAQHTLHFARYAAAFMAESAKGSVPPVPECDVNKPCPVGATCQAGMCVPSAGAGGSAGTGGSAGAGGSAGSSGNAGASGSTGVGTGGNAGAAGASGAAGVGGLDGQTGFAGSSNALGGAAGSSTGSSSARASSTSGAPAELASGASEAGCSCRTPSPPGSPRAFSAAVALAALLVMRRSRSALPSRR